MHTTSCWVMLCHMQKLHQRIPELEKSAAVAVEKMRLEEAARRKLEERLITVSCIDDTEYATVHDHMTYYSGQATCCMPVMPQLSHAA